MKLTDMSSKAKWILLCEKEGQFQRVMDSGLKKDYIIVTGFGSLGCDMLDLLNLLQMTFTLPIGIVTDCDMGEFI